MKPSEPTESPVAQTAGSAVPQAASLPKPSTDATAQRKRTDALTEACKILSVDVGNSGDAVAAAIENNRLDDARRAFALLGDRLKRAEDLLHNHIDKLPRITAIN